MTAPNMASLERSLQSFSLNHHSTTTTTATSTVSPMTRCNYSSRSSDATLELNSNITLPYHWEQCLDLKTGEMYFINWRTGMKSKEDPRTVDDGFTGYFYSDDDDADDEDEPEDDGSSYADSEGSGSSVESSPAASSSRKLKQNKDKDEDKDEDENENCISGQNTNVLVVAGCKGCFMYFMVPKQVEDCPKCCGQLLHFDRSDDN